MQHFLQIPGCLIEIWNISGGARGTSRGLSPPNEGYIMLICTYKQGLEAFLEKISMLGPPNK
jgi:hypothetical protein